MNLNPSLATLVLVTVSLVPASTTAASYAASVVQYTPGTGAAPGYDQPSVVLGEPSRITPGNFGGPVDPFNAPWQAGQLLSLGSGGSLTVRFDQPILNLPGNPFGLDFEIFAGAAFMITNGDYSGGGVTDGSLFGDNAGATRVSVSADGSTYFTLNPALAPKVDGPYPTDGSGDFSRPVDPRLLGSDFAGRDLPGIRALYQGSGGGMGYDLAWAQDAGGNAVALDHVEFVRIDVLGDRAEVDAFAVVPEPSVVALWLVGVLALPMAGRWLRPLPR